MLFFVEIVKESVKEPIRGMIIKENCFSTVKGICTYK